VAKTGSSATLVSNVGTCKAASAPARAVGYGTSYLRKSVGDSTEGESALIGGFDGP
jgi:hypothetical protein